MTATLRRYLSDDPSIKYKDYSMAIVSNRTRRNWKSTEKVLNKVAGAVDKVGSGAIRWAVTDHAGVGQRMLAMQSMGVVDTIKYILLQLLVTAVGALATGLLVFLLIGYGIPYFLFGHL